MRAEIEPQAGTGACLLSPALAYDRAKAIDMRLELRYLAEHTGFENSLRCEGSTLPSAVVKDREQSLLLLGDLTHAAGLRKGHGKRLVDNDMLACAKRRGSKR